MVTIIRDKNYRTYILVGIKPSEITSLVSETDIVEQKEENNCSLDPGGILNTKIKWHEFEVEGHRFEIQPHRCGPVLTLLDKASYNINGQLTAINMLYEKIIMPLNVFKALIEKVEDLFRSDEALHAEIDHDEALSALESDDKIIRASIPREREI